MFPTSERLNRTVRGSHQIDARVDVHDANGQRIFEGLKVEQGFVRVDDNREVRRRLTTRLMDYTGNLTPADSRDLLHPLSHNEIRPYRGVVFPDGTDEMVPQGVFGISDLNISDSREGFHMEVTGYDRAYKVRRRRFVNNYIVPIATNYGTAIQQVISFKYPGLTFDFAETSHITPRLIFGGSGETGGGNAWDAAQKMAESIGMMLYFDVMGVCTMRPVPSITTGHTHHHYHETNEFQSQVLYVDRRISDEDTFNHVVVYGETTSNEEPVFGEAVDDNPNSPTYIDGPFGDVPTFMRSQFVRTAAQANELARAQLRKKLGVEETIRIISIVHPGHEIGDVIHIWRERSKVDKEYIIDQFTMPLEASQALNIGVRTVRAAA